MLEQAIIQKLYERRLTIELGRMETTIIFKKVMKQLNIVYTI